jgi:hypothetical protein
MEKIPKKAWYREPFVWLVILFPSLAIIGGIITVYIAVSARDNLVEEDYYQKGLAINQVLNQDKAANSYNLQATLHFRPDQQILTVYLKAQADHHFPDQLTVNFSHSIHEELDQTIILPRIADDTYQGTLSKLAAGLWYIQLNADDWRLLKSLTLPVDEVTISSMN